MTTTHQTQNLMRTLITKTEHTPVSSVLTGPHQRGMILGNLPGYSPLSYDPDTGEVLSPEWMQGQYLVVECSPGHAQQIEENQPSFLALRLAHEAEAVAHTAKSLLSRPSGKDEWDMRLQVETMTGLLEAQRDPEGLLGELEEGESIVLMDGHPDHVENTGTMVEGAKGKVLLAHPDAVLAQLSTGGKVVFNRDGGIMHMNTKRFSPLFCHVTAAV